MMEDLNSQIAKLTEDYTRQQELNAIRSKLSEDKQHSNYNNRIQELRGFNPLSVQPHPQEQLLKRVSAPTESFMSTRNTRFEVENRVEGDTVCTGIESPAQCNATGVTPILRLPFSLATPAKREPTVLGRAHWHAGTTEVVPEQNGVGLEFSVSGTMDKLESVNETRRQQALNTYYNSQSPLLNNSIHHQQQINQHSQQNNRPAQYTREDMNARMDTFRFDNSTFQRGSLVPVNMDHYYSGNLFAEGNPVPEDLRNEYTPGQRQHPNGRVHYQEKSKTIYKDEFNARLSALSPLSRTLFYPAAEQGQQQMNGMVQQQQTINTMQPMHNINNRRQELNNRMSQHMPLSSAMALPAEYADPTKLGTKLPLQYTTPNTNLIPGQPKKVAYNTIYPVSSK